MSSCPRYASKSSRRTIQSLTRRSSELSIGDDTCQDNPSLRRASRVPDRRFDFDVISTSLARIFLSAASHEQAARTSTRGTISSRPRYCIGSNHVYDSEWLSMIDQSLGTSGAARATLRDESIEDLCLDDGDLKICTLKTKWILYLSRIIMLQVTSQALMLFPQTTLVSDIVYIRQSHPRLDVLPSCCCAFWLHCTPHCILIMPLSLLPRLPSHVLFGRSLISRSRFV